MGINSIMGPAVTGVQRGFQGLRRVASEITGSQSWYSSRLVQAREDLEKAENALQDFLDRQGLIQTAQGV